jgi:replicative DNA helicase
MSVKESLDTIKQKVDAMPDSESKRLLLARANKHLAKYDGRDKIVTSEEIYEEIKDKPTIVPMKTNHDKLDEIIKGFYPKQCIYIGANAGSGKTSFVLDLIEKMKDQNPLFISLEQSVEELVSTMHERKLDIPHFVAPRHKKLETIHWISDKITESVIKHDTRIVFIDHFGYLKNDGSFFSETKQITATLMELEAIADELDVAIVTIVHIRKLSPIDIPTKEHLQGSAGFDQQADTIIMLWREAYMDKKETKWSNKVLVSVQKNRKHGQNGSFRMKYEGYKFIQDDNITFSYEGGDDYGDFGKD